ncbi:MAG: ferritin family protein [Pseudomonadota bacterium]
MKSKDRLDALELALKNETKERAFYLKNAGATKNPLGRTMFLQIADEELEHHERLKQLHEHWQREGKWPETVPLKVKATMVREVLEDMFTKLDQIPSGTDDELDAVRQAIDFEAKGMAYYEKLTESVSDPKEKDFFKLLAKIEREHYLSLKDTAEFLVDPQSWYTAKERHILDGA